MSSTSGTMIAVTAGVVVLLSLLVLNGIGKLSLKRDTPDSPF